MGMHKDELIQLHTLLCQVKGHFERSLNLDGAFREYDTYGVAPQHIHKSKSQHKRAVFLLGKGLAASLGGPDEFSNAHKVGVRMAELANKVSKATSPALGGTA